MLGRLVCLQWALGILREEWGFGVFGSAGASCTGWPTRRDARRHLRQVRRNARLASLTARRNRAALEEAQDADRARGWNPIEDAFEADRC